MSDGRVRLLLWVVYVAIAVFAIDLLAILLDAAGLIRLGS